MSDYKQLLGQLSREKLETQFDLALDYISKLELDRKQLLNAVRYALTHYSQEDITAFLTRTLETVTRTQD